ncbi:MAG: hypothetical protein AABX89_05960 [Candidatus Thermoplasmatota archaeon]
MRTLRHDKMEVRRLERGELSGLDRAIPGEWVPRPAPAEAIEEPASLAGWSWGSVAPRSFEVA